MAGMEQARVKSQGAVVDFHGFKDNHNRFVLKEFAVVGEYFQSQLIFDAPYSECFLNRKRWRSALWLSRHFHSMKWSDQGIPYDEELIRSLCSPFTVLYAKGTDKVEFMRQFHNNVHDISESYAHSYNLNVTCILPQHNHYSGRCALRSAKGLFKIKFETKFNQF